jgi:hypothetical protein
MRRLFVSYITERALPLLSKNENSSHLRSSRTKRERAVETWKMLRVFAASHRADYYYEFSQREFASRKLTERPTACLSPAKTGSGKDRSGLKLKRT